MQKAFTDSYADVSLGLGPELFSKEIFSSDRFVEYFKNNIITTNKQKVWFAFDGESMVGTITI